MIQEYISSYKGVDVMRKALSFLLIISIMLCFSAAHARADSNAEMYENAIGLLKENKYAEAGEAFAALGSYYDSPRYMMYCSAIAAGEAGLYSVAVENLKSLSGFLDSSILATYYAGLSWEASEDYEHALELLSGISLYRDVASRIAGYPALIHARDYRIADENEKAGLLDAALAGFQALGNYEDSAERAAALQIRIAERDAAAAQAAHAAAYAEADLAEKDGRFEDAYQGFVALGDYSDSKARAEAVRQRAEYAKGMSLIAAGAYKEAYAVFKALGSFEDSEKKVYALGLVDFSTMKPLDATTASYQFHNQYGIIHFTDNHVVIPQWDEISFVASNCLKSKVGDLYGLVDYHGNELTPCKWYGFSKEADGLMVAAIREKDEVNSTRYSSTYLYDYFLIDVEGNTLTPAYKAIGKNEPSSESYVSLTAPYFSSGLIRVQNSDGKWGFVDSSGAVKIDMTYSAANDFSRDLAAVKDDRWGYINTSGEYVIQPQFSAALDFNQNDKAEVRSWTSWHVIDTSGAIVYFEGHSFDELPDEDAEKADHTYIINAAAEMIGIDPEDEELVWILFDIAEISGVITASTEEAILEAAEAGDADALLAAIEDMDAFLAVLGIEGH